MAQTSTCSRHVGRAGQGGLGSSPGLHGERRHFYRAYSNSNPTRTGPSTTTACEHHTHCDTSATELACHLPGSDEGRTRGDQVPGARWALAAPLPPAHARGSRPRWLRLRVGCWGGFPCSAATWGCRGPGCEGQGPARLMDPARSSGAPRSARSRNLARTCWLGTEPQKGCRRLQQGA